MVERQNSQLVMKTGIEVLKVYLLIGVVGAAYGVDMVYSAIRGRFDRTYREGLMDWMQDAAHYSRIDHNPGLWSLFWSRKDRQELQRRVNEGFAEADVRDAMLDDMSDEEIADYAGNHAKQFRFLTIPSLMEGERRDN